MLFSNIAYNKTDTGSSAGSQSFLIIFRDIVVYLGFYTFEVNMNWILPDVDKYVVVKIAGIWVHQLTQLIILKEKPRERSEEK